MKYLLILCSLAISQIGFSQNDELLFDGFVSGDLSYISNNLTIEVDLCLAEKQDFYSKSGAIKALEAFLSEIKAQKIETVYKGNSKSQNSNYKVANLIAKTGKYRVFIYFEDEDGKKKISELRIDKV